MSSRNFFKENLSIVIALALPIVVAVFFMISREVTSVTTPPPQHDFLLTSNQYNHDALKFQIVQGELIVTYYYPARNAQGNYTRANLPKLYYVNAETMAAREISFILPSDHRNPPKDKEGMASELKVSELEKLTISSSSISPDGYEFEKNRYRRGNVMTEIFASGNSNNRNHFAVVKDGRSDYVRGLKERYYNTEFLGWVTDKGE